MKAVKILPGIYWVGAIDWNLRYFHGHMAPRGTTYNSYLILDEKAVLVDTVKAPFAGEMLARIKSVINPEKIDIIVVNHVESDHSGSLPVISELAGKAQILATANGEKGLERLYKKKWNITAVKAGDELKTGALTLKFFPTPMVHWPDSMVTYIPERKLLLSNDAFGQHLAGTIRLDDELEWPLLREEAGRYYANIVLPYGEQVTKTLDALASLDVEMIAPSHGIIWRKNIPKIIDCYRRWAGNETSPNALIVYDTMWGSTEKMASTLLEGLEEEGIPVSVRSLESSHISDIMTDLLECRTALIGTPTLNRGMLPTVSSFLTYLKGLRPKNRIGFTFGSYGWSGEGPDAAADVLKELGWMLPLESFKFKYKPEEDELESLKKAGRKLGYISREGI